ncbi:MFS transporter [Piscinibacter sakaiensis]|uniref:MFS transporter n=1 Tax=Piscinibacter sakaiensis TaxID=1547922 RepID=UPI003AAE9026
MNDGRDRPDPAANPMTEPVQPLADPPAAGVDPQSTIQTAIVCLSLAALGSGMAMRINDAMLLRLAGEFGIGVGSAAQVISIFAVAYGVAQLGFGPMGERWGKYRVIAWACVACAIVSALCALATDFVMLRVLRALAGACAAGIIPLAMAWIGDVVSYESRQPVLARFLIGQIVGLSAGVWLGGFAADHLSWQAPYWVLAVHFIVIGSILLKLNGRLPDSARITRRLQRSPLQGLFVDLADVLRRRWARVILATVLLEGALLFGPFSFIAVHLNRVHGLSLSAAGSLVMLFGLGGFLFASASRRLVRIFGEVGLARWGGGLLALSYLLIAYGPGWAWAIPGTFGAGLGFYMLHNTLQVNATQMAPELRGPAVTTFASCLFFGQSIGVAVCSWLVSRIDTATMIAGGAAGLLLVSAVFARLRSRHVDEARS